MVLNFIILAERSVGLLWSWKTQKLRKFRHRPLIILTKPETAERCFELRRLGGLAGDKNQESRPVRNTAAWFWR